MIDMTVISQLGSFFASWVEGEGRQLIYMPRFIKSDNLYGQCSRCVDEHGREITDNDCPDCFGTGFNGGYYPPITGIDAPFQRCYGFFNTDKISTDWQKSGVVVTQQNQQVYIKLKRQPFLSDLLIDDKGVRYRVGNEIDAWSFNNVQIGYVATVYMMTSTDTLYRVPVPALPNMSGHSATALTQLQIYQPYTTYTTTNPSN